MLEYRYVRFSENSATPKNLLGERIHLAIQDETILNQQLLRIVRSSQ